MAVNLGKDSPDSKEILTKETDGLSFFTADDNDTSSESENDEESSLGSNIKHESESSHPNKLPSPTTLFATVGKPKFLETPSIEANEVDWNRISKRYEPLFEYSSVSCPVEHVDLESDERNEASISGAPIKYKTEVSETKRHLFLHGKRSADLSSVVNNTSSSNQGIRFNTLHFTEVGRVPVPCLKKTDTKQDIHFVCIKIWKLLVAYFTF